MFILPVVVSELTPCEDSTENWKIRNEIICDLAEPSFFKSTFVDLLIESGAFYDMLEVERIRMEVGTVSLQIQNLAG